MILSETIETSFHPKTIELYHSLGYIGNLYEKLTLKVKDLPKNSRVRINVKCDICGVENNIIYNNYNRQIVKQNYYCCHPCSFEKNKKTNLERFGCEHSFQSEEVKSRIRKTLVEKYGYDHPTKCPEIFEKAQKSAYQTLKYKDTDYKYQGSYELDFIEYSINKKILFEKGPTIRYKLNDKKRVYHSDFYLPIYNLICEVKSTYTFNDDYEENRAKEDYSIKSGYNFLFIIDKDYTELEKIIKQYDTKENG
jgi:hypothetical protein